MRIAAIHCATCFIYTNESDMWNGDSTYKCVTKYSTLWFYPNDPYISHSEERSLFISTATGAGACENP